MTILDDEYSFSVFLWTPTAAAIIVAGGRFYIRFHYIKAARWDDFFCALALASLITFIATDWYAAWGSDWAAGLNCYLASNFFLWATLYSVKASFLALMWSVFKVLPRFRYWWWAISFYTLIGFLVSEIGQIWTCGNPSDFGNYDICMEVISSTTSMTSNVPDLLKVIFHISSDLFILALPLFYIRKLQMSSSKKVSVAAVFALTIIDIITGILRNASAICEDSPATWNNEVCIDLNIITAVIEPSLAVIVCALPAYRAILPSSRKRRYESMEMRRKAAIGPPVPKRSDFTDSSGGTSEFSRGEPRRTHDVWYMAGTETADLLPGSAHRTAGTEV